MEIIKICKKKIKSSRIKIFFYIKIEENNYKFWYFFLILIVVYGFLMFLIILVGDVFRDFFNFYYF